MVLPGIPPLKQSVVETILSGAFLDFSEFPPSKGILKVLLQGSGSKFVVANTAEMVDSTRVVPNFSTCVQCFAIYAAAQILESISKSCVGHVDGELLQHVGSK